MVVLDGQNLVHEVLLFRFAFALVQYALIVWKIGHFGEGLVEGVQVRILGVAGRLDLVGALVEEVLWKVLAGDVSGGIGADDLLVLASIAGGEGITKLTLQWLLIGSGESEWAWWRAESCSTCHSCLKPRFATSFSYLRFAAASPTLQTGSIS